MQFDWLSLAVLLFMGAGIGFAALPVISSHFVAPRSRGGDLELPYECGITPHGRARVRFGINYYFYALLFLAFDVDVLYLMPVAAVYPDSPGWTVFIELLVFIGILALAVIFFWRKGVFTWPRRITF
ncbi:MAG: NADH-quinone oxidoreductase subunit A [Deltaproteobacteria bacterium]|nr:NADH-quinone oxidoreductase subunit A [Deltaproteobacteria bacterium]